MIRIDVRNSEGVLTNTASFADQASADAWLQNLRDQGFIDDSYQSTTTDTSALDAAKAALAESDEAINVGRAVLSQIRTLNKQKGLTGPQVAGLFTDPTLLFLLLSGSLTLAKNTIIGFSNPIYTADDKALLVSIIDQSGLAD